MRTNVKTKIMFKNVYVYFTNFSKEYYFQIMFFLCIFLILWFSITFLFSFAVFLDFGASLCLLNITQFLFDCHIQCDSDTLKKIPYFEMFSMNFNTVHTFEYFKNRIHSASILVAKTCVISHIQYVCKCIVYVKMFYSINFE